jgi:hypothetical protein
MLTNPEMCDKVFINLGVDRLMIAIEGWINMYSATFIETALGSTIRSIVSIFEQTDYRREINSEEFNTMISELINLIRMSLEGLHSMSPMLASFICEIADQIVAIKG